MLKTLYFHTVIALNSAFEENSERSIGKACGDASFISVGAKPEYLASPYYPSSFHSQTQCNWVVATQNPSQNVKIIFDDWSVLATGIACDAVYLEISSLAEEGNPRGDSWVKFCGKNPGYVISDGNRAMISLHADAQNKSKVAQRFKLRVVATWERAKMPETDGKAVKTGTRWGSVSSSLRKNQRNDQRSRPQPMPPIQPAKRIMILNPQSPAVPRKSLETSLQHITIRAPVFPQQQVFPTRPYPSQTGMPLKDEEGDSMSEPSNRFLLINVFCVTGIGLMMLAILTAVKLQTKLKQSGVQSPEEKS